MKTIRFQQHLWCADCSLEKRGVVLWNEHLPVNYLCLFSRVITYFMHAFKRCRASPFDTWWWWTASKDLPQGGSKLTNVKCTAIWKKRLLLDRMCGTVGLSPSSRACRTINHDGLMQTRNSQARALWVCTRSIPSWKASHFKDRVDSSNWKSLSSE